MAACSPKSPSEQIDLMQKRLTKAEMRLEVLRNEDFDNLIKKCMALDTVMPKTDENWEKLFLMKQYLQQMVTNYPLMQDNIKFSRQQLSDLKDDITANILDAADITTYIGDEEAALKEIEAQVNYFEEKFDEQNRFAKKFVK